MEETAAVPQVVAIAGTLSTSTGDAAPIGEAASSSTEAVHTVVSEGAMVGVGGEVSAVS